jgi:hypothetical protein
VRPAHRGDCQAILGLVHQAHQESLFSAVPFATEKVERLLAHTLAGPARLKVILAERDGVAVGVAVVEVAELLFSPMRAATVVLLFVAREARGSFAALKLLRALRRVALDCAARVLSIHVTTGRSVDRSHRLFTRLGFRLAGGNYLTALS